MTGMTLGQRRLLKQALRWSAEVPRASTQPDKRRAANKVLTCLRMLLTGRAPTEIERQHR